jgi:hypothetical protein
VSKLNFRDRASESFHLKMQGWEGLWVERNKSLTRYSMIFTTK